jgi:hypothetical protein
MSRVRLLRRRALEAAQAQLRFLLAYSAEIGGLKVASGAALLAIDESRTIRFQDASTGPGPVAADDGRFQLRATMRGPRSGLPWLSYSIDVVRPAGASYGGAPVILRESARGNATPDMVERVELTFDDEVTAAVRLLVLQASGPRPDQDPTKLPPV